MFIPLLNKHIKYFMEKLIKVSNIDKSFKKNKILDNVSFELEAGNIYGFIGPNGAGKTTTIKIMLGLITPDSGRIYYKNKAVGSLYKDSDINIGALVNSPAFYGDLSAKENMRIIAKMKGVDEKEIDKVLETMRLGNLGNKKCKNFSMGMKQRLGIAEALLSKPEIIILDEPINALDPQGIYEVRELILELKKKYKTTVFVSSHVLSELEMICDQVIIIDKGKIRFSGDIENLKQMEGSENLEECYFKLLQEGKIEDGNRMV